MSSDLSDEEGASPNPSSEVETQAAMEAIRERQQVGTCPRVDYVYYIGICCSNPSSFLQSLIPELIPSSISHLPLHHVYFPFLHLFPYSSSIIYLISPFFIPSFNHSHVPLLPHFPILHSLIQPFPCSSITSFPHSSFPHSTIPLFLYYLISPFFIPSFNHSLVPLLPHFPILHSPIPSFNHSLIQPFPYSPILQFPQSAFQVCERMFSALLAWATTRDVRYLLAAQRSLTAVQNQQGDTWARYSS